MKNRYTILSIILLGFAAGFFIRSSFHIDYMKSFRYIRPFSLFKERDDGANNNNRCRIFTPGERNALLENVTDQFNPRLMELLRCEWLNPPLPYICNSCLKHPNKVHYSQRQQSEILDQLMENMTGGFYVECGALDGEQYSNSLFFERVRHWDGLLIEPNPETFKELMQKYRHAYSLNACLNTRNTTNKLNFYISNSIPAIGGLKDSMAVSHKNAFKFKAISSIQCFPLASVMQALGRRHIDLFVLDVEGAEMEILETIPFDWLTINVILVEYIVYNAKKELSMKRAAKFTQLLSQHYDLIGVLELDLLFVRKGRIKKSKLDALKAKYKSRFH